MSRALPRLLKFLKALPFLPPTPTADPTTLTSRKLTNIPAAGDVGSSGGANTPTATGQSPRANNNTNSNNNNSNNNNNNSNNKDSNGHNPPSSSSSRAFRIAYNLVYYFLYLVLVAFLCVSPGDLIRQAVQHDQRANIVSIAACYLASIIIVSIAYSARLYFNRVGLAAIPRGWVPVEKGEVPRAVRAAIVRGLSRSAAIAWRARPWLGQEGDVGTGAGMAVVEGGEEEDAGAEIAPAASREGAHDQQAQPSAGAGARIRRAVSVPFERLSKKRKRADKMTRHARDNATPNGDEQEKKGGNSDGDGDAYGINIIIPLAEPAAHPKPWGEIEHPGWAPPAAADLPGLLHYEAVIAELPNLIEAKALTLGPLVSPQASGTYSPMSPAPSGDHHLHHRHQQQQMMLDPDAVALLQRPECMGLREYLSHLAELGVLVPTLLPIDPPAQNGSSSSSKAPPMGSAARPPSSSYSSLPEAPTTSTTTTVTADFLARYEAARFSARALTNAQFRTLMHRFADVLRSLRPLDPAVPAQFRDADTDDDGAGGGHYDGDETAGEVEDAGEDEAGDEDEDEDKDAGETGGNQEYYGGGGDPGPSTRRGGRPPYYSLDDPKGMGKYAPRGTNPSSLGRTPRGTVWIKGNSSSSSRAGGDGGDGKRAEGRSGGAGDNDTSSISSAWSSRAGTAHSPAAMFGTLRSPALGGSSRPMLAMRQSSGSTWHQPSQFRTAPTTPKSTLTLQLSAVGGRRREEGGEGSRRTRKKGRGAKSSRRKRKDSNSTLSASSLSAAASSPSLSLATRRTGSAGFFDDFAQTRPDLFAPASSESGGSRENGSSSSSSSSSHSGRSGRSMRSERSAGSDGTTRHHSTTGPWLGREERGRIKQESAGSTSRAKEGSRAAAAAVYGEAGPCTHQTSRPGSSVGRRSSRAKSAAGGSDNGSEKLAHHQPHYHHRSRRRPPPPRRRPRAASAAASSLGGSSSAASMTGSSGQQGSVIRLAREGDTGALPYVFCER